MMEGTVQLSIKDFEKLRETENLYKNLVQRLSSSAVSVKEIEVSEDEWYRDIMLDADKLKAIAIEFVVDEVYTDDSVQLNIPEVKVTKRYKGEPTKIKYGPREYALVNESTKKGGN
jgi:hypothetical protein